MTNANVRQTQLQDDMMAWDTIQKKMMCCGIDGPRNWYDINNGSANGIPASCCRPQYIDRETMNCLNAAPLYMDRMYQVCALM